MLDREVLEDVRERCDFAAAAASLACAEASRSAAVWVCLWGEPPAEIVDDAGDVDKIASVLASTDGAVVSTIDVGRDLGVGNATLGVRDDEGPSPRCVGFDMITPASN
jgi:hypothetical protein